ncbi:M48 family metalloprotease [Tropicimonas sp. IMCC34043]|uniref:M48 family metalloprotease n=1 Tax=Tropicimonas sp. IMCC34043 TaxID=2248760 RepID=UPI000E22CAC9|nr:M48 family metalloprotease [Tropicimonas sp. IMCC34043]
MAARRWRAFAKVSCAAALLLVAGLPARAQTILRDAEAEYALSEVARPVLNAAGVSPSSVRILIIKDSSLNAYVLNAQTIAIHSGLLMKITRPEMLQGVIAHEVAHIANGHLASRPMNMRNARTAAAVGLALAAAVATQNPSAGAGLAIGTQSAAKRAFLAHTRAEEASADQSGLRYLSRAGVDPQGMIDLLDIFSGQEALSSAHQDPYVLSHPLSSERLRSARGYAAAYGGGEPSDPETAYWFDRSQAKLAAYLRAPGATLRRISPGDTSDATLVARTVANQQAHDTGAALQAAEQLIAKRPDDVYARELKAWILLESRQFGAASAAYAEAVALAPNDPLMLAGYGRALLAEDTPASNAKALEVMEKSRARDQLNPSMLRDLGLAYARAGQNGMASVVTAERYALSGRLQDAAVHAKRAQGLVPRGSPAWRRADDIVLAAKSQPKRKSR